MNTVASGHHSRSADNRGSWRVGGNEQSVRQSIPDAHSVPQHRIRDLDGLRAIAVLVVMYSHYLDHKYWFLGIYWARYGVELFFVLSGFLITLILLRDIARCQAEKSASFYSSIPKFYISRYLRLAPALYVGLVVGYFAGSPEVANSWWWHAFYASNVFFAIRGDWYGSVSHFWSLSVEEQFYLLWPLVLLLVLRRSFVGALVLLIISAPLYRVVSAWAGLSSVAIGVLPPNSFDALSLGALLAVLVHRKSAMLSKLIYVVPLALFVWLLGSLRALPEPLIVGDVMHTAICVVFAWVIFSLYRYGITGKGSYIFAFPALAYIGKISYGMYVVHAFSPGLADKMLDKLGLDLSGHPIYLAIVWAVITIMVASACWHIIETPINRLRSRL
jgi:peptidoglycan/LPS O-acetylase OafA/YrhL